MRPELLLILLAYQPCSSRPAEEESVVSVYTTQGTTSGTHPPLDVYHQIASNIAERITSPIYRFLGIGRNRTNNLTTTKRPWQKIEILEDSLEEVTKPNYLPVDNDISKNRDIEELSVEALRKSDRKPEKIILFSSYLPVKSNLENLSNDTNNDIDDTKIDDDDDDDTFTLDDVAGDDDGSNDSYFFYILELLGSFAQLLWGGITAWFSASGSTNNEDLS